MSEEIINLGLYRWCGRCHHAYHQSEWDAMGALCPTEGCDDRGESSHPWSEIRQVRSEYPIVPDRDAVYAR